MLHDAHFKIRRILSAMLACVLTSAGMAWTAEDKAERHPLAPGHVKGQFAGNMGFLSAGIGYSLFDDRLQSDLFYGYAPKRHCGVSVHQVTWKNTVLSGSVRLSNRVKWIPVTTGAHLTCKVGNNNRGTWVTLPGRYPDRYYPSTALHLLLTLGTCLDYRIPGTTRHGGVYFEAGTTALYLRNWIRQNHVSFRDIVSLDLGITRQF